MKISLLSASLVVFIATSSAQNQPRAAVAGAANDSLQAGQTSAGANDGISALPGQSGAASAGATMEAELTKGLDAKKAKAGDPVMAKCTREVKGQGDFRIPKNAKLIGHLTEVQARGKGQGQSKIAISFDKAQLKDGREIPLRAVIQAIAAAPAMAMEMDHSAATNDQMGSARGGTRASAGGVNSTVDSTRSAAAGVAANAGGSHGSTAGNVGSQTGAARNGSLGSTAATVPGAATSGVIGLKGLQLDAAASNATQGSVIRSSSDNVRLESGTRLVLRLITQ